MTRSLESSPSRSAATSASSNQNPGYLDGLRVTSATVTARCSIFDEVQTGFRVDLRGAQGLLGVVPDLTCLGKAMSAGFPVSAIGGRADIMELIADRRVLQAGTYNTNPHRSRRRRRQPRGAQRARTIRGNGPLIARRYAPGLPSSSRRSVATYRGRRPCSASPSGPDRSSTMREGWRNDVDRVMAFKRELRLRGVYTKPTPRDIWYVSTEHNDADVATTLEIAADAVEAARSDPAFT